MKKQYWPNRDPSLQFWQRHHSGIHLFLEEIILQNHLRCQWPCKGIVFNAISPIQGIVSFIAIPLAVIGCLGTLSRLKYSLYLVRDFYKGILFINIWI